MDGDFRFELGAFRDGFEPTASNVAHWQSHWVAAGVASYNPVGGLYDGQATLESNAPPFVVNGKAWIRGIRDAETGSEWVLFRGSSWRWPVANPINPPLIYWNAADADEVVLGEVRGSGSPFLIRSASVSSYAQWVATALGEVSESGPGDDPDRDGVPNLMEFVLGTPPLAGGTGAGQTVSIVKTDEGSYLEMLVPRRRDRLAILTAEVSGDLDLWLSGPEHTRVISDGPEGWRIRDLTSMGETSPRRFIRVRAILP